MKTLRIGPERFTVTKVINLKKKCSACEQKMTKVITKKAGTFEVCSTCKSTLRIPE